MDFSAIATESLRTHVKSKPVISAGYRRGQMWLMMLLADVLGFAAAGGLVWVLNQYLRFFVFNLGDLKYLVIPALCLVLFINSKLYPGVGINPAEEIKLVTTYITHGFLGGWVLMFIMQARWTPNHLAFPILWWLSILSILMLRWGVRILSAHLGLWGEPVVVIGRGQRIDRTIRYFAERQRLGFVPVLAAIDTTKCQSPACGVPVIEFRTLLTSNADRFARDGIETALVDDPAIFVFLRSDEAKELFHVFRRLILLSDVDWIDGASMRITDFEGIIGIAAEKSVLTPIDAFVKRSLDVAMAILTGILGLPLMIAAAIWIKLDSPGGVFYSQERLGKNGRMIKIYKFRSMFTDAESALQEYLGAHPEARCEWEEKQKLSEDPRITRAGGWLRKFSIDEMPQLFSVLKGEMSLVGPRPIVEAEAGHYDGNMDVYTNTRPGMTGLWQVSGRSRTSYEERVRYDTYYVRNWSVWLDIYILLRTVLVVVRRDGAY